MGLGVPGPKVKGKSVWKRLSCRLSLLHAHQQTSTSSPKYDEQRKHVRKTSSSVLLCTHLCHYSLDELNTDVLLQIFECLQQDDALFPLSMTCWEVRKATFPVLFSRCSVLVKEPLREDCFLPRSLWPYVRYAPNHDRAPDEKLTKVL